MIAYGSCVGDWYRFARNVAQPLNGRVIMALSGQPSIAVGYNAILDHYRGRNLDAVVLLHDDLEITDPLFEHQVTAALMGQDVALVGVAGGGPRLRWWDHNPVGHQMTDSGLIDFGRRTGDVDMLEGSVLVFSPWAVENLRVDERYTDFRSGWDDVCLTARAAGKRCVVADVDTHHHSTIGWKSPQVEARFTESEIRFRLKWRHKVCTTLGCDATADRPCSDSDCLARDADRRRPVVNGKPWGPPVGLLGGAQ